MIDYSIIGKRFGRLVVIELDHIGKNRGTWWKCKCDCGNEIIVYRGGLTSGDNRSCGCYRKEHLSEYGKTHGLTNHPLYTVWGGMVQRCTDEKSANYDRYGGRGINICNDWRNNFSDFYDWAVTHGYEKGLTLDRIDNDGDYKPDNCRWATRKEQQANTRRNHNITYNGETHILSEWSRMLNVNCETLRYRVNHGNMSDFEAYFEEK